MKKKLLSIALVLCMLAACIPQVFAESDSYISGSYEYNLLPDDTACILYYSGTASKLTVPSTLGGSKVTMIAPYAFAGSETLKSITLPSSVTGIESMAFAFCPSLTDIQLPAGLTRIGGGILWGTPYYDNTSKWQNGALYIGKYLIDAQHYDIEDGVDFGVANTYSVKAGTEVIASNAFAGRSITSLTLPDSIKHIGDLAFVSCSKLKSIKLPAGIESIGAEIMLDTAFYNNTANWDTHVLYKDGYLLSGQYYSEATDKTLMPSGKYTVKSGTAVIADYAFQFGNVTNVAIPDTVKTIGLGAFYGCNIKGIIIPSAVENIRYCAVGYIPEDEENQYSEKPVSGFVVVGEQGSAAQKYASQNHFSFYEKADVPERITLGKTAVTIGLGETYAMSARTVPANVPMTSWTSSNKAVASVSGSGKITGQAIGSASVTAKSLNSKKASAAVTVKKAPASIKLNKTSLTLGVDETYSLSSTVNSGAASLKRSYTSSNTSVASVKSDGTVTAKKAGTATITVKTYNGKSASCKVTVKKAPISVKLNKTALTMGIGETYTLSSTVNTGAASLKRTYASSSTSVASISSRVVSAKKAGTSTITVKTYNGKSASCKVTVKSAPTSIKLNRTSITLRVGQTCTLSSTVNTGAASLKRSYTTSNSSVATIKDRVITAKKPGTATITVKTYNGKTAACKVTVKK